MAQTKLHVGDCPMTNSSAEARTGCVCDHHEGVERDYIEGSGGLRTAPIAHRYPCNALVTRSDVDCTCGALTPQECAALSTAEAVTKEHVR